MAQHCLEHGRFSTPISEATVWPRTSNTQPTLKGHCVKLMTLKIQWYSPSYWVHNRLNSLIDTFPKVRWTPQLVPSLDVTDLASRTRPCKQFYRFFMQFMRQVKECLVSNNQAVVIKFFLAPSECNNQDHQDDTPLSKRRSQETPNPSVVWKLQQQPLSQQGLGNGTANNRGQPLLDQQEKGFPTKFCYQNVIKDVWKTFASEIDTNWSVKRAGSNTCREV